MRPSALLRLCLLLVVFLITSSQAFGGRDWNAGDADLPEQLRGLNQDQLNAINKTKELNPAEDKFNPALLAMFLQTVQSPPVVRTGHETTALPPVPPQAANDIGGAPLGIGLGPSPTDGPVVRPGEPVGRPTPTRTPEERAVDEAHFGAFFAQFFIGEQEYEEIFPPDPFEELWRRSGSRFGDCIGADCIPHVGFPGEPLGGPPIGSWVHHDRGQASFRFAGDAAVLAEVRNNNFTAAQNLIRDALGQEVRHDPRGKGF